MCCYWTLFSKFVIAGNHESETMNQMYGFEGEVKSKYSFIVSRFCTQTDVTYISCACFFLLTGLCLLVVLCKVFEVVHFWLISSNIIELGFSRTRFSCLGSCLIFRCNVIAAIVIYFYLFLSLLSYSVFCCYVPSGQWSLLSWMQALHEHMQAYASYVQ